MTTQITSPIRELFVSAGLISQGQLQTALYDQEMYQDMRLGEILVSRGWLGQQTADFFCEALQHGNLDAKNTRIGECLLEAALIDARQIQSILDEQRMNHLRFGSMAVLKGYISQQTLDFFLQHVYSIQGQRNRYFQANAKAKATLNQKIDDTHPQNPTLTEKDTLNPEETLNFLLQDRSMYEDTSSNKEEEIRWIV